MMLYDLNQDLSALTVALQNEHYASIVKAYYKEVYCHKACDVELSLNLYKQLSEIDYLHRYLAWLKNQGNSHYTVYSAKDVHISIRKI